MTPVYAFPANTSLKYARMATPDQMLFVNIGSSLAFQTLNIPKDTVAKAVASLKSGGKAEDAELPPS